MARISLEQKHHEDGEQVHGEVHYISPPPGQAPLRQSFNWISMLATMVSLMATWEAFCSTMAAGLISGGPVSLVYGYIIAIIGTLATAFSLSECASMLPSAGGQYHYVAEFAPDHLARPLSWLAGWVTTFGWQAVAASAPFLAALMIQSVITLNDPTYEPQRWHGTLIYWAVLLVALLVNTLGIRILAALQEATMALHVLLFLILLIVCVVVSPVKSSAEFVFTEFINASGWESDGVAWCIGLLSSCYVLVGYDGATHLSEEMNNPAVGVPRAMIGSIILNGIMGFGFIIMILFCVGDIESVLDTKYGFPIVQIFYNITNSTAAATAMTSAIIVMATLATIPLVASAARVFWSLARDKAFPFAKFFSRVDEKRAIPTIAIVATTVFLAVLGLLNIASTTAFNAILSLAVVGLYFSYGLAVLTILWRRIALPGSLVYGPFRLGKFGIATNIVSLVYTVFSCIFLLFPPYRPVTAQNLNYAPVVLGGVLIFSGMYWILKGRKVYTGPVIEVLGRTISARSV